MRLRVPDDSEALYPFFKVRLDRKCRKKCAQFTYAAEILNLDVRKRNVLYEGPKEVDLVVAFNNKLNRRCDCGRLRHALTNFAVMANGTSQGFG